MDTNKSDPLRELKSRLAMFASQRDWQKFHSPKNLSMALIGEAAELVEIFQWITEEKSLLPDPDQWQAARMEMADIFIYLIRIADRLDVNLIDAAQEKIEINERRYPINKVKGSAKRASEYSHNKDTQRSSLLRDPVTGLLEYPVFRLTLEPQLARCRRYDNELCLIRLAFDFTDKPKDINYHAEHLRTLTQTLKQNLRWADQVGKADNGQFIIALPETSVQDTKLIIDKLQQQISRASYVKSITYGVSAWTKSDDTQSLCDRSAQAIVRAQESNTLLFVL